MEETTGILGIIILCGFVGCLLGVWRERRTEGLVFGALLGPIGWILILYDCGWRTLIVMLLSIATLLVFTCEGLRLDEQAKRAAERVAAKVSEKQASAAPPRAPSAPQNFFPEIHTLTGYTLHGVSVKRCDEDGFLIFSGGKIIKLKNTELSAETFTALRAVSPAGEPNP